MFVYCVKYQIEQNRDEKVSKWQICIKGQKTEATKQTQQKRDKIMSKREIGCLFLQYLICSIATNNFN